MNPSAYDLSCWWDVKHKHDNNKSVVGHHSVFAMLLLFRLLGGGERVGVTKGPVS